MAALDAGHPGPETAKVLQALSSDPFVQAAIWRLWHEAPAHLDQAVLARITRAYGNDYVAAARKDPAR